MSNAPVDPKDPNSPTYADLSALAAQVFVPSAPISQRTLFAGRVNELNTLFDALATPGQHIAVYGERGVGKTSLVSVSQQVLIRSGTTAIRENCQRADTFGKLWRRSIAQVVFGVQNKKVGFEGETSTQLISLADRLPEQVGPDDVVTLLRGLDSQVVFIFDEFDILSDREVAGAFAQTIKALSDHDVLSKLVLVGVGDTIDHLIASHASIARALIQIRMPRMAPDELTAIITTGCTRLQMEWNEDAAERVVKLSQGLPHYVHRLALFATREALEHESLKVTMDDVKAGMKKSVETAQQSLTEAYLRATVSQRSPSLFGTILLAAALSKADDLGYFRPFSLRRPLRLLGQEMTVQAFASHLNKFASEERGNILQKTGMERQHRYRFVDPLMQPYVIMRGISENHCPLQVVDEILSQTGELEDDEDSV